MSLAVALVQDAGEGIKRAECRRYRLESAPEFLATAEEEISVGDSGAAVGEPPWAVGGLSAAT
jgi:hypothetical protein